jgi:adenylate cyclase
MWRNDDKWWIEDLESRLGTFVNGTQIKGNGICQISLGDKIRIGNTDLTLESDELAAPVPNLPESPSDSKPDDSPAEPVKYSAELLGEIAPPESVEVAGKLLRAIHEITMALGRDDPSAEVGRMLVSQLRDLVPRADHAALLLLDDGASDMVLAAHNPEGDPRVSTTLARLAIERKQAIIWVRARHGLPETLAESVEKQQLENVLCAPLLWQARALGALWLSGPSARAFTRADLSLVAAVAHQAAMTFAVRRLQQELGGNVDTLKRIMAHFAPRVAARLLEQARQGRLRPGGTESQVTVLCCDLRGFSKAAAGMPADDVVDLLNEYFAALASVLSSYGGTIDKFIGDAILAVFGSPDKDPDQHTNAVSAAVEMQQAMRRLNADRRQRHAPALELGVGIHCGKVLHGFIGSAERVEFTVIGDAVNKASRYCDGAGPGEIVISPEVHQIVWKKVKARRTDITTKHEGVLPAFLLLE